MPGLTRALFRQTLGRTAARLWPYRLHALVRRQKYGHSHSQHGEDVFIAPLIDPLSARFVVDVGAHDGFSWSNSYRFLESGFGGLLVEPIPEHAQTCRHHHQWNPRVVVEETAILPQEGRTTFYLSDDAHDLLAMTSSVRRDMTRGEDAVEIDVACCPLETLLLKHNVPHDYAFLNVDAEGMDLHVLETAALSRWRPSVICVEFGPRRGSINSFLRRNGYQLHGELGGNGIYRRVDPPA